MDAPRRLDPLVAAGALLALAGLAVLVLGTMRGVPLVLFATEEERAARDQGRALMVVGAVVLAVAGGLLWTRGLAVHGALALAAGLVPVALALLFPEAGWAWLGLLALAPLALVAALLALAAR
jgi:hypothetical protein